MSTFDEVKGNQLFRNNHKNRPSNSGRTETILKKEAQTFALSAVLPYLCRAMKKDYKVSCCMEDSYITNITDEDLKNAWTDRFGVTYSSDGKKLLKATKDLTTSSYTIREGTVIICDDAFHFYCPWISSVQIPNSVVAIGKWAFSCTDLSSIDIPNGITTIEYAAFFFCMKLRTISIPGSVTTIGDFAFDNSGLEKIYLSENIKEISNLTSFYGCLGLTIYVPVGSKEKFSELLPDYKAIIKEIDSTLI